MGYPLRRQGTLRRGHMPLAHGASKCYFCCMRCEFARRLLVLLLSVAVVTGLATRVGQAGSMDMTAAAMTTTDMPVHGKCDGCAGSEKAVAASACFTHCSSIAAVPAIMAAFDPPPVSVAAPAVEPAATGHAAAPDPYPPRPIVLS